MSSYHPLIYIETSPAVGPTGATGPRGSPGRTGSTGRQGPPSGKGESGARGSTGPTGLRGSDGREGQTGATGRPGPPGSSAGCKAISVYVICPSLFTCNAVWVSMSPVNVLFLGTRQDTLQPNVTFPPWLHPLKIWLHTVNG